MRSMPEKQKDYEAIFDSLVRDVEAAYALRPADHQMWRDFYHDANIGWLYLRRGDDYAKEQRFDEALADYELAARRIQPASKNAALDLTETLFKAGLTGLRLGQPDRAARWYDEGMALVESEGARFELGQKVQPALDDLARLIEEQPDLAEEAAPILDQLSGLTGAPPEAHRPVST
jgi:tetratricopeptide (TPR) repeat protein